MLIEWIRAIGPIGLMIIAVAAVYFLRDVPQVKNNWSEVAMPLVALIILHLGIYWIWGNFWSEWYKLQGFFLLQFIVAVGFYIRSLSAKQAKVLGTVVVVIGSIGLSMNLYEAYKLTYHHNPAATVKAWVTPAPLKEAVRNRVTVSAPTAPNWSRAVDTPGPFEMHIDPNDVITARKSNGELVHGLTRDGGQRIGNTTSVEFQSEKPTAAVVAVVQ